MLNILNMCYTYELLTSLPQNSFWKLTHFLLMALFFFQVMMPERVLGDYGLNCSTAKAQAPAQVGLAYKNSGMLF